MNLNGSRFDRSVSEVPAVEAETTAPNAAWAVLQDEHSAEAHTPLAHVKSTQDWDWLGAEREFQRALGLEAADDQDPVANYSVT